MPDDRRPSRGARAASLFYLAYGALYAGFFVHTSRDPDVLTYSASYAGLLLVLAAPFAIPTVLARAARRLGARKLAFALIPTGAVLLATYAFAHLFYDYTREYRFDPFLQQPHPRLEDQYPAAKGENVFRILALGGSTTRGFRLAPEDAYPRQLERVLRERAASARIEVLNAGQDWYTTKHSLIDYVTYAHAWNPDLVIVMHGINDVGRAFSHPEFAIGEYDDEYSNYYAQASGAAQGTTFEQFVERQYFRWLTDAWFSALRIRTRDFPLSFYRSIRPFKTHLEELVTYARADGAEVMLVNQSFIYRESMTPEEMAVLYSEREMTERAGPLTRLNASTGSLSRALAAFNAVTETVARERGALFVDAAGALPADLRHHMDDVHHTPLGTRRLAEAIADVILDRRLIVRRR